MNPVSHFSQEQLEGLMRDLETGIRKDLEAMIRANCHVPLALTLSVLTETLGGFIRGTFRPGESRSNWEAGLESLGASYKDAMRSLPDPLYHTLRCAFVHTYIFSKEVNGRMYRLHIHVQESAGIDRYWGRGVVVEGQAIEVHANDYAADLLRALTAQFDRVRGGDNEARQTLEGAILSQRVEDKKA